MANPRFPVSDVEQFHEHLIERVIDPVGVIKRAKGCHILLLAPPRGHAGEEQEDQRHGETRLNFVLYQHFHKDSAFPARSGGRDDEQVGACAGGAALGEACGVRRPPDSRASWPPRRFAPGASLCA
jgi:hypothetical protein